LVVDAVLHAEGADVVLVNVLLKTSGFWPFKTPDSAVHKAALLFAFKKAVPL
jgi:hypothetical protein